MPSPLFVAPFDHFLTVWGSFSGFGCWYMSKITDSCYSDMLVIVIFYLLHRCFRCFRCFHCFHHYLLHHHPHRSDHYPSVCSGQSYISDYASGNSLDQPFPLSQISYLWQKNETLRVYQFNSSWVNQRLVVTRLRVNTLRHSHNAVTCLKSHDVITSLGWLCMCVCTVRSRR